MWLLRQGCGWGGGCIHRWNIRLAPRIEPQDTVQPPTISQNDGLRHRLDPHRRQYGKRCCRVLEPCDEGTENNIEAETTRKKTKRTPKIATRNIQPKPEVRSTPESGTSTTDGSSQANHAVASICQNIYTIATCTERNTQQRQED